MRFYLFSKIRFEIPEPIALIECYCYQNDFFSKYDVIENRTIKVVNKVGARLEYMISTGGRIRMQRGWMGKWESIGPQSVNC